MTTLLLDPFSGVAGDMFLGLLLDLGLDAEQLQADLAQLPLAGYRLEIGQETRQGISGTRLQVVVTDEQPCRTWTEVRQLLDRCTLEPTIVQRAQAVFRRLAEAEGQVHGVSPEQVHFHEVGAVDALVDIVGVCAGLHRLGIERICSAPLPLGRGFVDTAHGRLPLPAPATLALLQQVPIRWDPLECELVTPTGAALMTALAHFCEYPDGQMNSLGHGVGRRDLPDRPNLLRGMLMPSRQDAEKDCVAVLESHLDDANPEWLGALMEDLLEAGALDVAFAPLQMKKNRPGTGLTVIANPGDADKLINRILQHSSTAGVRHSLHRRHKLRPETGAVVTPLGPVPVKRFYQGGTLLRTVPEYRGCRTLAKQHQIPLPEVYQLVQAAIVKEKSHS